MLRYFLYFSLATTCLACDSIKRRYRTAYNENTCIKEINRSYASVGEVPKSIYKLEKITKEAKLKVSIWHNYSWTYQGLKDSKYFENTKLFEYDKVDCPDGSDTYVDKAITDKLKNIDL